MLERKVVADYNYWQNQINTALNDRSVKHKLMLSSTANTWLLVLNTQPHNASTLRTIRWRRRKTYTNCVMSWNYSVFVLARFVSHQIHLFSSNTRTTAQVHSNQINWLYFDNKSNHRNVLLKICFIQKRNKKIICFFGKNLKIKTKYLYTGTGKSTEKYHTNRE